MADDPSSLLGDNDSDDYPEDGFRVNKSFSGRYDTWRQKEEMQKLKDLKKDMSDSSSSESESEEEPVIEEDFLKALSMLKSDDPRIYSEGIELFKEEEEVKEKKKVKKEKPMYAKDLERELVLNRNGEFSDEEDHKSRFIEREPPSIPEEEMKQLKAAFPNLATTAMDDSDDEDDGDLLKVKQEEIAVEEQEKKEADYLKFLKGQKGAIKEDTVELNFLHEYWNDPKLDKDEKFLRDYLLHEKFVVKDKSDINTTYSSEMAGDLTTLSDEEEMLEQQEKFEHKYNFRFEEPDTEFIKRYPRTIGDSLRREDNRRKQKREEYTERKKKEKEQKKEELKRLKALKRKEIEERFLKLKEVCGQDDLNLNEEDMDSDFDPDKHDRKMKELFNDDYYSVAEQQKPEFEYDEDLDDEKWDMWTRDNSKANGKEIDEDCDADEFSTEENIQEVDAKETFEQEMVDSTRVGRKKGKKKSLFAKIISQPKPIFDPDGKSFDDYLEEYYKMDFEDVVGDLPVRFKYRKVVPNDFGLSVDEILAANDKELNRWCSVKKTCQYRHEEEEKYDVQAFQKKAQVPSIKQKAFPSVYSVPNEGEKTQTVNNESKDGNFKKKRRGKKKKNSAEVSEENNENESLAAEINKGTSPVLETSLSEETSENKKSKKKTNSLQESSIMSSPSQSEDRSMFIEEIENTLSPSTIVKEGESMNKKSRRKRKKANGNTSGDFQISNLENNSNDKSLPSVYQLSNSADNSTLNHLDSNLVSLIENGKAKRKLEDSIDISDSDKSHVKKKKKHSEGVESPKLDQAQQHDSTNLAPEETPTVSQTIKKSKKKKKKSKNKQDVSNKKPYNQDFSKKNFSSNSKTQTKVPEGEKKLALPNSRLASYGLNPKKFKNRIIYSK